MHTSRPGVSRRSFLAATAAGTAWAGILQPPAAAAAGGFPTFDKAQIAITLDLEMARNFPRWQDTHWDYEKGNLTDDVKAYALAACRLVRRRGGLVHTFVVGRVFEQENVDWLGEIAAEGHPIGNHTYDHVHLLATSPADVQYRFKRAPWLLGDRSVMEILRENIRITNIALESRLGIRANGFRTPGGFANGLNGREDLQQMLQGLGFDWISGRYPSHAVEDMHGTGRGPTRPVLDSIVAAQPAAQPYAYPTGLLELPMSPISDVGAFRTGRWRLEDFLHAVRLGIDWAIEHRACFDFLAHPSVLGVADPEFRTIELICDLVDRSGGAAEIVTLDALARKVRGKLESAAAPP